MIGKPFVNGVISVTGLLGFYFGIIGLVSGWDFAWTQFSLSRYWIIGLAVGFGVQVGLFTYLRALHRARMSGAVAATTGTVSGSAMVACCAHYLVNIMPIVGISGFAAVVGQYQQSCSLSVQCRISEGSHIWSRN